MPLPPHDDDRFGQLHDALHPPAREVLRVLAIAAAGGIAVVVLWLLTR